MSWKVGKINLKWLWGTKERERVLDRKKGRIKAHNWHEWHFYFPQWCCCCCCRKYSLIYSPKKVTSRVANAYNIDSPTAHYVIVLTTDTLFLWQWSITAPLMPKDDETSKKLSKEQGRKIYKKLAATSYLNPHNSRNFQAHSNLIASDAIMKNWLSMNFNCFIPIPSFLV